MIRQRFGKLNIGIMEIAIPLFYIVNQYSIAGVSFGLVLIGLSICLVVYKKGNIEIPKSMLATFLFMLFHDLVKCFFVPLNTFMWIERIIFFLFLSCVIGNVDKEKLFISWRYIGIVAMIGLYVQSVQVYLFNQPVSMIKIIPVATSEASTFTSEYLRPHSIFLEPAAYATWMLPLLCMLLIRKRNLFAGLVTLSILLSTSSVGIAMTAFVWLYYSLKDLQYFQTRRNALIIILALFVGGVAFANMSIFSASLDKMTGVSLEDSSNSVRLSLGYELYRDADVKTKVVGIPFQTIEGYLKYSGISLRKYGLNDKLSYLGFVNGFSDSLLYYGIMGVILHIMFYASMFRRVDSNWKIYVIICFLSMFAQSVFWNAVFVTQISAIFVFIDGENTIKIGRRKEEWEERS